jgi:hypothetical protein
VVAHDRHEISFNDRVLSSLVAVYIDPPMAMQRLRGSITGEIIADVLVLGDQKAVGAVLTFLDIDNHVPLAHFVLPAP